MIKKYKLNCLSNSNNKNAIKHFIATDYVYILD